MSWYLSNSVFDLEIDLTLRWKSKESDLEKVGAKITMCLSVKPKSLIIDSLLHFICPSVGQHVCHLLLQEQLVHCCVQFVIDPAMILQVFFHQSEILSSISSSLHFHDCSSWISWTCRGRLSELLSENVVSVFSWSTLRLFHFVVSVPLCQAISWKQRPRLQGDF